MAIPPVPKANPNTEKRNILIENLLDLIIVAEGTNVDKTVSKNRNPYDTIIGYDKITFDKPLTEMTLKEIRENGRSIVNATRGVRGKKGSSAVGAFQMLSNEFEKGKVKPYSSVVGEYQKKLNLPDDTLFTKEVQRSLAKAKIIEMTKNNNLLDTFVSKPNEKNLKNLINRLGKSDGWEGLPTSSNPNKPRINFNEAISSIGTDESAFQSNIIDINVIDSELDINDQTKNMLQREKAYDSKNDKIDEQEINAGDNSLESQRERQRAITKQKSGINFSDLNPVSTAEGADLERINRTVTEEINKVNPIDADSTRDRMEVITPPTNAASDAFQTDQMMEDYNTVNKDEELFRGSMNEDTEVEPLGDMSYPEGYTGYDSENNAADEQEFDEYTVVDREGLDYDDTAEVVGDTSFFESLFTDADVDTDYNFEVDDLNLEEGGSVEKKANFDGKEEEVEEVEEEVKADPPPGAKPSEVADDIPAMLSEGEYVLPANVVRYLGLERIIDMHRQVLCEIQQMEDLGMIQNVDENGKPEEDDKEMQFAEDVPSAGAIEIIVASPKPKGIMSFDSGGAFEFDSGGAEGGMADYDSGFDTGFSSGGSDGPDPTDSFDFGDDFAGDDLGTRVYPDSTIRDYITDPKEEFGDDPEGLNLEKNSPLLTEDFEKAAEDSDKVRSFKEDMEKIKEDSPIGGRLIEGVMQMIGLGRVATAMEEFNNFMGEKRLEARNAAADKARAEGKNEQEIQEAMNAAWASPGFSAAEDAAFEGQFNEVSGYGDTGSKLFEKPLNYFKSLIDDKKRDKDGYTIMDTGPMASYEGNKVKYNVEDPLNKYRGIRIPGTEGMTTIANEGFASGGLMQKKKFNQGGAYIEGVGYRDITQPMSLDSAFDTEVKTYEDVIAEMQGFTGRDKAPEQENLDRKQGKLRRQRSRELPYLKAGNPNPKISRRDPYLDLQLRNAGVDVEEFGDVIEAYREGKTQILPRSGPTGNRQLIKTLDNYTESKRMQYDGFTQKDLNNLPEGATNREVLKKIFNTELQFRDGKFGYPGQDDQDFANVGEEVGQPAPIGGTGAPFRPMQGARFKEMYLEEFKPNNSKAIELKLDEKADIEQINRATSFLNTQGDEKYIDPNNPNYIDNIFREFNGFRGTGLWELDSKRDPLKTTSSALMGNQYVEGVGYR